MIARGLRPNGDTDATHAPRDPDHHQPEQGRSLNDNDRRISDHHQPNQPARSLNDNYDESLMGKRS